MNRTVLIVLAFVLSACNTATMESDIAQTDSIKVGFEYKFENQATLTGILETLRYTNVAGEWFNTHILKLDSAISVTSSNPEIALVDTVNEIQIGFDNKEITQIDNYLNKRIVVMVNSVIVK